MNFSLWLRKTAHLSKDDFAVGMIKCESLVEDAARDNKLAWPPTYAEFIGHCKPPKDAPKPAAYRDFPVGLPEPKEHRKARQELGMSKCKGLMEFLNDE